MGCILFAGALDGSREGLAAQVEIAAALADRGMQPVFAVRGKVPARAMSAESTFEFLKAPPQFLTPRVPEPHNYVDLLLNRGFGDANRLAKLVSAWSATIDKVSASVLVVCGLPEALLAARIAGLPAIQLSYGFEIPPANNPMPVLRPWVKQAPEQRSADEAQVLRNINALLGAARRPALAAVHRLFASEARLVASLPDLDPFGPRKGCTYAGPLSTPAQGRRVTWPATARRRVLVHFRELPQSNMKAVNSILGALARRDSATVALLPGSGAVERGPALSRAETMARIHRRPVDWSGLLAHADVCVFDGDPQVAARCALAGVPLICTPQSIEAFLLTKRIVAADLGAGVGLVAPNIRGRLKATLKEIEAGGQDAPAARARAGRPAHSAEHEATLRVVALIALFAFIRTLQRRVKPLVVRDKRA